MKNNYIVICLVASFFAGCAANKSTLITMSPEQAQKNLPELEKSVKKNPEDFHSLFQLAKAHDALGQLDQALKETDQVILQNSNFMPALLLRARVLGEMGKKREQFQTFNAILKLPDAGPLVAKIAAGIGAPFAVHAMKVGPGNNLMAKYSPDGTKIVWQSDQDGDMNLYLGQADGSLPRLLTVSKADDEMPRFSPDGQAIVFTSSRDDLEPKAQGEKNRELYFLKLNSRTPQRLTRNTADDWGPAFVDSLTLIYVSEEGDNRPVKFIDRHSNLFVYSLQDSSIRALTQDPWDNTSPVVLPDGKLAWVRIKDQQYSIMVGLPGKEAQAYITGPDAKSGLAVSPDGKKLAFFMQKKENIDLYLLDLQSKKLQRLTSDPGTDFYPAFSPDGQKILFSSNRHGRYELYTLDLNEPISRQALAQVLQRLIDEKPTQPDSE